MIFAVRYGGERVNAKRLAFAIRIEYIGGEGEIAWGVCLESELNLLQFGGIPLEILLVESPSRSGRGIRFEGVCFPFYRRHSADKTMLEKSFALEIHWRGWSLGVGCQHVAKPA